MRAPGGLDPRYVGARKALLDVLQALGKHRDAVVLVGAQAVYLNVGEATEPLSSFTKDADLALNPQLLAGEPALEMVLAEAGFQRRDQPGLWFDAHGAEVDVLVPASIAGRGRRGANLGLGHERTTAMRVAGLEAALIDNSPRKIASFEPTDSRSFVIAVAGPAALLVSKLHKIGERNDGPANRLKNKDASDLFLLLQRTPTEELSRTLNRLLEDPGVEPSVRIALHYLEQHFGNPDGMGLTLLRGAIRGIGDEDIAAESCMALVQDLLSQMEG
jgi:hypothetical protein